MIRHSFVPVEMYEDEQKQRLDTQDQLAIAEDTVEVLEGLLAKCAKEIQRLNIYNELLRSGLKLSPQILPQPWVWPNKQPPYTFPSQTWCNLSTHRGRGLVDIGSVDLSNSDNMAEEIMKALKGDSDATN